MLHKTYALIIWSSLVVVSNNKLHYKTAETNNHIYHFVLTKENCTKKAITLAAFYMILTFSWYNSLFTHELWTPCEGKEVPANGSSLRPFLGDPDISLAIHTKVTKGTGPVRRLGKIEHGTFCKYHIVGTRDQMPPFHFPRRWAPVNSGATLFLHRISYQNDRSITHSWVRFSNKRRHIFIDLK